MCDWLTSSIPTASPHPAGDLGLRESYTSSVSGKEVGGQRRASSTRDTEAASRSELSFASLQLRETQLGDPRGVRWVWLGPRGLGSECGADLTARRGECAKASSRACVGQKPGRPHHEPGTQIRHGLLTAALPPSGMSHTHLKQVSPASGKRTQPRGRGKAGVRMLGPGGPWPHSGTLMPAREVSMLWGCQGPTWRLWARTPGHRLLGLGLPTLDSP